MVGFCHLTESHHNHHGQKPIMVGICHGGNTLANHDVAGGDDDAGDDNGDDNDDYPSSPFIFLQYEESCTLI